MAPIRTRVAVAPDCWRQPTLAAAAEAGGATIVPVAEADALVWAEPSRPELLPELVHPGIRWVQLPYAGIEPFIDLLDRKRIWSCAKGVYAKPVAEHVLALTLAGLRGLGYYIREHTWSAPRGRNLHGARVLVLGGGGITAALLTLLEPFGCQVVVVRRRPENISGAHRVVSLDHLHDELPDADVVVVALALTPATRGVIGATELALMAPHAWLINVARGGHVDSDALDAVLAGERIGGAALDVTDPEPLPPGHPLWSRTNCIITPHVGNTPEMGLALLADAVTANVRRWVSGARPLGIVDLDAGY